MYILPRWRKTLTDLWGNKARSILVILSIAVGVFAVGFVSSSFDILLSDMQDTYIKSHATEAQIYSDPLDKGTINSVRTVEGVEDAEGRSSTGGRLLYNGNFIDASVVALPPVDEIRINRITPVVPDTLPKLKDNEVLIENSGTSVLNVKPGDTIEFQLPDGRMKRLTVAGFIRDPNAPPYIFTNQVSLYTNQTTIEYLGGSPKPNVLYLTVTGNKQDEEHVRAVAKDVGKKIEHSGAQVYYISVYQPGRHWASDITRALGQIMSILGVLSVFLGTFLVMNTINALINQQVRQIGIMRAIGARRDQVVYMYLGLVIVFGALALAIALPLSSLLAYVIAQFISGFLNFQLLGFRIPLSSALLQIAIALIVPLVAAFLPVLNGTRVVIREALTNYGIGKGKFGQNFLDRVLERVRIFTRPILISLRNTFRRKTRLFMTLSTLTLAGAIFIAVFNLQLSFKETIDETLGYFIADVTINFNQLYHLRQVEPIVSSIDGVELVENWGFSTAQIMRPDGKTSTQIVFIAPPSGSTMISPSMTGGRWLVKEDENAIVIGNHLQQARPELKIGDTVKIEINGKKYDWKIIGTYKMAGNTDTPLIYTNYDYLAKISKQYGAVYNLRVKTTSHDQATQERVLKELEKSFKEYGIKVGSMTTAYSVQASNAASTNILVYFLLVMSVLIALVGGLGLSGTMSMNVLERTREIGVMRSVGASDRDIVQLVLIEGMIIGVISWIIGAILALPISYLFDVVVGLSFVQYPLNFVIDPMGFIIWLGLILIITAVASYIPARNASRLTVREVLAYE